jgi:hypothetical protein
MKAAGGANAKRRPRNFFEIVKMNLPAPRGGEQTPLRIKTDPTPAVRPWTKKAIIGLPPTGGEA